ncbi:YkgJ family cysteine cluster protein [Noviherbaspirillum sp. Root189]|uniref:YkgJ family cysteine cluster protein n=1 Tax=Noviherbaspirillum sp. Root189 TaxID=1736487 RepID=UPI001F3AB81E|nr:YkgJ family cysteine cluster protein [Noviherbaspirillum sp. Root189]
MLDMDTNATLTKGKDDKLSCRSGCGACCTAPSISSAIPGMPEGKPAGVRCVQLDARNQCMIFGKPERPAVCESLQPSTEMCGESREYAMQYLARLDALTS